MKMPIFFQAVTLVFGLLLSLPASAQLETAKTDFIPGDILIFFDSLTKEKIGEFPSKWDLQKGTFEVAKFNGDTVIAWGANQAVIKPLMSKKEYLPEQFTVEFEAYFYNKGNEGYFLYLNGAKNIRIRANMSNAQYQSNANIGKAQKTGNEPGWRKFAISFNKRALKVYLNGERLLNIPNVTEEPKWIEMSALSFNTVKGAPAMIKNIRVAKGGVPLYDRLVTDGKFAVYDITFDVNKAVIKPESQKTIAQIASMLKEHPEVRVLIEGHTDSDGADDFNLQLSQQRAEAVKAALGKDGIDTKRMETKGLGESKPIADNSSDDGKAQNRRVEFVLLK